MAIPPILPVYVTKNIQFVYGEGVYLYDESNRKYLDFAAGIAVNSLGHKHPALIKTLKDQGEKLWHVSNLYTIPNAVKFAEKLIHMSFADTVFFTNSGAEAIECAFKIVRSYQNGTGNHHKYKIISLRSAFHGRTFAACSANEPSRFSKLLYPYLDWFDHVIPDLNAIEYALSKNNIGAVLLEPIQGEGGINVLSNKLLQGIRKLCDKYNALLIFDCIQCGSGRSGRFFAYEESQVLPDICTLAKGIGGGFPLGACLSTEKAAHFMSAGMHGSTYSNNPLATAIGYTVVEEILKPGFLENVVNSGNYLQQKLTELSKKFSVIQEIKGKGLMIGIKVDTDNLKFSQSLMDYGLLTVGTTGDSVVRFLPPLIVTKKEIDEAMQILEDYLKKNYS